MEDATSTCKFCIYWTEFHFEQGECNRLDDKIDIEIGDGGFVRSIETPSDFGCNLWKLTNKK